MTKTFPEVISGIRTAKKGVEVREDIAQMGEYVEQFASTATTKAGEAEESAERAKNAVAGIDQQKADAVKAVQQAQATATNAVTETKNAALQEVSDATADANSAANAAERFASAAAGSASTASGAATTATTKASEASTSAEEASASREAAEKAQKAAEDAAALAGTRANTDKTFSIENAPADAKFTGDALAGKLSLSGGTMTGPIIMPGGEKALSIADNAATHSMVYRGKALGSSVTSEQFAAISAGTFEDLYLGDYWSIGGVDYLIAAFNYWLTCGDTACNTNHLLVVPRNNLYTYKFNPTNTTEGGYVGSDLYKNGLTQAKTTINNAFGSAHILNHRQYLVNAVTNGAPTGTDWYDSTVELMNENMVYGGRQFSPMPNGATDPWNTCRNYTIDKSQLSLFRYEPWMICNRNWYWLRDVVSAATFADVHSDGTSDCNGASNAFGVRPVVGIC